MKIEALEAPAKVRRRAPENFMKQPDYSPIDLTLSVEVDTYLQGLLMPSVPCFSAVLTNCDAAGLPPHEVPALQAELLSLIVHITRATRVLEISALGGYSAICMARPLPVSGQFHTIKVDGRCAEPAAAKMGIARLLGKVALHRGEAVSVLPALDRSFDLPFIDADKPNNLAYLLWALALSEPGTVVNGSGMARSGAILESHPADARVQGARQYLTQLGTASKLRNTVLQTACKTGWEGFWMSVVRPPAHH